MEAGFQVQVSGVWFDPAWVAHDLELISRTQIQFRPALDFRGVTAAGQLRRMRVRLGRRWARARFQRCGCFSPQLLGYGAAELRRAAREAAADLTIVHSEAGLWVAQDLLRRGRRVGVDFEDWFSRDLPESARAARPIGALEELERLVARQARYLLTTSRAMSAALARAYGGREPTVVYNSFPSADEDAVDHLRKDRLHADVPSLHWFSQTIGPDRGLELLFEALPLLSRRVDLYLRGAYSAAARQWLQARVPPLFHSAVHILPLVSPGELPSRIAEHDLGFALESGAITSRDLSISNKLFQYLSAGLPVIATPTQGQREVLSGCGPAGTVLEAATPVALAQAINRFLTHPELLATARVAARAAAQGALAWEAEKGKIVAEAERAFSA